MFGPLDETNSHGIRVVADRGPLRKDVQAAFAKGSRKATTRIDALTHPRSAKSNAAAAKRAK